MSILEQLKFKNKITVKLNNAQTGQCISTTTMPNIVTNSGKQLTLDALGGIASRYIKHCAVGHSGGTASAGSVLLVCELTRNAPVYTRAAEIGTFSAFFNAAQANSGQIKEIAFFGGTSSFTSTNTGTMFNRILLTSGITKTANYTLTIDLDIGF